MCEREKIKILWIYEYKDDESPVGATIFEGPLWKVPSPLRLPHLHQDYHYEVEILTEWKDEWV